MRNPGLTTEQRLFAAGHQQLAGLDEVGRGAWAGPLVAAAALLTPEALRGCRRILRMVGDSKTLSERQRERAYERLAVTLSWGIGMVMPDEIDGCGLTAANQLAFDRALGACVKPPVYVLADGRGFHFPAPHRQIINGDATVFCIAAASIIAKVTRDRLMQALDRQYPAYGFSRHKGYGTTQHQAALARNGPCPIHRRTFRPVVQQLNGIATIPA